MDPSLTLERCLAHAALVRMGGSVEHTFSKYQVSYVNPRQGGRQHPDRARPTVCSVVWRGFYRGIAVLDLGALHARVRPPALDAKPPAGPGRVFHGAEFKSMIGAGGEASGMLTMWTFDQSLMFPASSVVRMTM